METIYSSVVTKSIRFDKLIISICLDGYPDELKLRIPNTYRQTYFRVGSQVYIRHRIFKETAIYGNTSMGFEYNNTRVGIHGLYGDVLAQFGILSHPLLYQKTMEDCFTKHFLLYSRGNSHIDFSSRPINEAALEFGRPTTIGFICDTEMNMTLAQVAL